MRPIERIEEVAEIVSEVTVLLVDNHPVCRAGIRSMLEGSEFHILEEAETGEQAVRAARRLSPDLVMLEIRMPDGQGFNVLKSLKAEHPQTAVVIVTMYDNPIYLAGAIAAGASAYLLKGIERDDLLHALRRASEGETLLGPRDLARSLRGSEGIVVDADLIRPLSRRESEVLRLLGLGLHNRDIARFLSISESTVKTHVEHIVAKLGLSDRMQAAVWAALHAQGGGTPPSPS